MATQDLSQLYQTATDAFRRATPTSKGLFGATQYPNQGGITTLPTGTQTNIIEGNVPMEEPWKPPAVMPPTFDSKLGPVESIIPDEYGGFFQSQFYNPEAMSRGVLSPVTLPSGETITFGDSESARQFQQYLDSRVWQAANGGMVGMDYLTRRL